MIHVTYKGIDITGITISCRIEKNISAAGSEAEITVICSPGDRYLPMINPACGNAVCIEQDSGELFNGTIERLAFSADQLTVTLFCFDSAALLAKNELYAAFRGSPPEIASAACTAVGLETGTLWQKEGTLFIPASCALSAHQIIRQAYGGQCVIECADEKIDILKPGARRCEADASKLLGVWARHSAENIVNRAMVIGYMGRHEALAQSSADIAEYGARQRVYTLSGTRSNAPAQASAQLSGIRREAGIKLFGLSTVKCGDLLALDAPSYGVSGEWIVTSVGHEISGGFSTTNLGLVGA